MIILTIIQYHWWIHPMTILTHCFPTSFIFIPSPTKYPRKNTFMPLRKKDPCRKFNAGESFQPLEKLGGGNSNIFLFSPLFGKIPILTKFFRRGWFSPQLGHLLHPPPPWFSLQRCRGLKPLPGRLKRGPTWSPYRMAGDFCRIFGWRDSEDFWQAFYLRWWYVIFIKETYTVYKYICYIFYMPKYLLDLLNYSYNISLFVGYTPVVYI